MTQHIDLDALQAQSMHIVQRLRENADLDEMEHCNPTVTALERNAADAIELLCSLIARLRKAEAQHADLLKSMFEIAWGNASGGQSEAAKQACLRNPALGRIAAPSDSGREG